ncbi:MAG TPA: hypothetical protein VHM26_16725, partial [Chitinophagaceae bacterium]|nr:hypothetical protein [Chitinophagaceae bacterium]
MRKLSLVTCLLTAALSLFGQTRIDSLTRLIDDANDASEKARLLVLRSKSWPNTQIEKPLADAQQALAYYQQTKNEEGQVDAYQQLSGLYSRQNKYKMAIEFDSVSYQLADKIDYKKGKALSLGLMGRNQQQLGNLEAARDNCLRALQLLKEAQLEAETADIHSRLGVIY